MLEAAVAAYVDQFADVVDEDGHRLVVRNGYHHERDVRQRQIPASSTQIVGPSDHGARRGQPYGLQITLHDFGRIWLAVVQLATELTAWMQYSPWPAPMGGGGNPKRLRLRLLCFAGKLARKSRQTWLSLSTDAPWVAMLTDAPANPTGTRLICTDGLIPTTKLHPADSGICRPTQRPGSNAIPRNTNAVVRLAKTNPSGRSDEVRHLTKLRGQCDVGPVFGLSDGDCRRVVKVFPAVSEMAGEERSGGAVFWRPPTGRPVPVLILDGVLRSHDRPCQRAAGPWLTNLCSNPPAAGSPDSQPGSGKCSTCWRVACPTADRCHAVRRRVDPT
jgi:hypothetical protein